MDVDKKVQRLKDLMTDSQANMSEIISIYNNIVNDGTPDASSVMPFLKQSAVDLLSPELITILRKYRLEDFSHILVANSLLDVDDVKDDLEVGDVLVTMKAPAIAIRRLKLEFGVAPGVASATPATLGKLQAPTGTASSSDRASVHAEEHRLALEIKKQCQYMKNVNGIALHKLQLNKVKNFPEASSIVRRFAFGEPDPCGSKACKTILLMSATDSGKPTMINAITNYVLGVQLEDPFRFVLIDEDVTPEALSQTKHVTVYDIHYRDGFRIPYSLTIVDTPGFGYFGGNKRDEEITSAVKQLVSDRNGIQGLSAVGFVVQSALAHLTVDQKNIFSSVLSIFGKNPKILTKIGDRRPITFINFADGRQPLVLAAIKEANLLCLMGSKGEPCHRSFNNDAAYASNQTPGDRLSPSARDNAMQNFEFLFAELSRMENGMSRMISLGRQGVQNATTAVASPKLADAFATSAAFGKQKVPAGTAVPLDKEAALLFDENRLAIQIKNQCSDMKKVNDMIVYKLPLKRSSIFSGASSIVRRFSFGEPDPSGSKPFKTILLMGAFGSGKTTMINAMVNYVLDVQWEDPFRFMLIDEDGTTNQALSQTSEITAYDIHYRNGFRIPFSLTIVDTPGFGDTQGIERDKQITSAIKQFFEHENGIQALDAVGFVVQSSLVRLTSSQTYIFNSVMFIFGKDIGENVRFLVTFEDGRQPPVLAAIKKANLPCQLDSNKEPCHQSFNNGVVYVSNQIPGDRFSPIEWDNAIQNFRSFFVELSKMPIKSLQLTKNVLNSRESLCITIQGLETTIQAHLMKMKELRKTEEIIALNKEYVNANKNFEFTVKVLKKKKVGVNWFQTALNCSNCEVTCHYPCNSSLWTGILSLKSSDSLSCKVCPGKCATEDHSNELTRWEYVQEDETRTLYDIRKKYEEATEKTLNAEELKNALQGEAEQLKFDIIKAMDQITHISNLLKKIALRGDPLTTPEYINLIIEKERQEKKPGHEERIKSLGELLKKARLTRNVTDGGDLAKQFLK